MSMQVVPTTELPRHKIQVNASDIPWLTITKAGACYIEFDNSDTANDKTVRFHQSMSPLGIDGEFTVATSGGSRTFTLSAAATNGNYAFTSTGGSEGSGGIEISR